MWCCGCNLVVHICGTMTAPAPAPAAAAAAQAPSAPASSTSSTMDPFTTFFGYTLPTLPLGAGANATGRDVMRICLYFTRDGKSVEYSARAAARIVRAEWLSANQAVLAEENVVRKVKQLYEDFGAVRKSHKRGGEAHNMRVARFVESLDAKFLISSDGPPPSRRIKRHAIAQVQGKVGRPMHNTVAAPVVDENDNIDDGIGELLCTLHCLA